MLKGIINIVKDNFNKAEFSISPNKKVKSVCKEFKENFGLTLVMYKGNRIAEDGLTIKQLNDKTSKNINKNAKDVKIKASMTVKIVEGIMEEEFGIKTQIKDPSGKKLIDNKMTLGDAAREHSK